MPLSDLARETPSLSKRSFITLNRNLFFEFNALVYYAYIEVFNIERNANHFKVYNILFYSF